MFPIARKRSLLAAVLVLLLVETALLAELFLRQRPQAGPTWQPDWSRVLEECMVREPAPEIDGEDIDGRPLRLRDYRGRVVVVSFWVTW